MQVPVIGCLKSDKTPLITINEYMQNDLKNASPAVSEGP